MHIIIPITGHGSRFVAAGYKDLKPFIKVMGMPILEWITKKIFPGETNITFICRKFHLETITGMAEELRRICPTANIFAIDQWAKNGPVFDVMQAAHVIDNNSPVIINYCDFYMHWDWLKFKDDVLKRNCDGSIPCYTGFHPHLLPPKNLYASCRVDDNDDLLEIREKHSFTEDKILSRHSPGAYYFKNGFLLKKYCQKLIDSDKHINGEYYASLPYNFMVEDGLKVWCPTNVEYFCQWGTPEDLQESLFWLNLLKKDR